MDDREELPAASGLRSLIADVFAAEGDQLRCSQAAQQIALAADAAMSDEQARERFPQLFVHFRFCPDCLEEYELLLAFARAEAAGAVPVLGGVPPLPVELRGSGASLAGRLVRAFFTGFAPVPPLATDARLRGAADFQPVELAFEDGFTIRLDAERGAGGTGLRLLTMQVQAATAAPTIVELLSGREPNWLVEDRRPFGPGGDATLLDVPAGAYTLHLVTAGRSYLVEQFVVP